MFRKIVTEFSIKEIIILILVFLILGFVIVWGIIPYINHKAIAAKNKELRLALIRQKAGSEITLEKIVPFAWDDIYIFESYSYTDQESFEKKIGIKLPEFHPALQDKMINVVIVKDKKLVCYVSDFYDELGYRFDYIGHTSYGENLSLKVEYKDGLYVYC